jgi:Fe-S cluster assembly ATP-binding protein
MGNRSLIIRDLRVTADGKKILSGVSLTVNPGNIHVIMGPNGSGKSTLAAAILGYPYYEIGKTSRIIMDGYDLRELPTDKRVKRGLFLAFQNPIAVPGVSVISLLRTSFREICGIPPGKNVKDLANPVLDSRLGTTGFSWSRFMKSVESHSKYLGIDRRLLLRGINDGFSGGEKKKTELLAALTVKPRYAIFDEIDTGLDIDALKTVAHGIKKLRDSGTGIIVITHYQRILKFFRPDNVHILVNGKIAVSGKYGLVRKIEREGYRSFLI